MYFGCSGCDPGLEHWAKRTVAKLAKRERNILNQYSRLWWTSRLSSAAQPISRSDREFKGYIQTISPLIPPTLLQRSSAASSTSAGNGPFLIIMTVSRICSVLLAPRIIPSPFPNAELYAIQRIAASIGVIFCNRTCTSNFLMAECTCSPPKSFCAPLPSGLLSSKRVPPCSLLTSLPVRNPAARGLLG